MFICEIWLFDWYFPQFCTSDLSKYGYLEVFQRVCVISKDQRMTLFNNVTLRLFMFAWKPCSCWSRIINKSSSLRFI